jgi:hypothetical protein
LENGAGEVRENLIQLSLVFVKIGVDGGAARYHHTLHGAEDAKVALAHRALDVERAMEERGDGVTLLTKIGFEPREKSHHSITHLLSVLVAGGDSDGRHRALAAESTAMLVADRLLLIVPVCDGWERGRHL